MLIDSHQKDPSTWALENPSENEDILLPMVLLVGEVSQMWSFSAAVQLLFSCFLVLEIVIIF